MRSIWSAGPNRPERRQAVSTVTSVENKDFDRRGDRPLVRMLAVALGIGVVMFVLAAGMIAMLGLPAGQSSFAAASVATNPWKPSWGHAGRLPVQRIGDPYVRIDVLVQAGQDPHIFEPTPRQIIRLSQARLSFCVGLPFEDRLIERVEGSPARFTIVDATAGINKRPSRAPARRRAAVSDTGPLPGAEGDDDEGGTDPHVWLSPRLLRTMAANVAAALSQTDPRHESVLPVELQGAGRPTRRAGIAASPAAWRRTAGRRSTSSIRLSDTLPTPTACGRSPSRSKARAYAAASFRPGPPGRADRVKIIFLQPQFNQQIAASIALAIEVR